MSKQEQKNFETLFGTYRKQGQGQPQQPHDFKNQNHTSFSFITK
jgi:hypothetical protein